MFEVKKYLTPFVDELRRQGVSEDRIDGLVRHWQSLGETVKYVPCPYCVVDNLVGGYLIPVTGHMGKEAFICRNCTAMIAL